MRTAFVNALVAAAAQDERIHLLTADLGYSVLEKFRDAFPGRYTNVGVAEQNMIGVAAGMSLARGKVVFVYSIANFPTMRCFEQIRNDVCYHQANVKLVAVGGGLAYGAQGYTHHGVEDLAVLRSLPGMTVIAPGDPAEVRLATAAFAAHAGPGYLRLGKGGEPQVHSHDPHFQIGRAIPVRHGRDVALIATGAMLPEAVRVADLLATQGLSVGVVSMPTVKPLDVDAVVAAATSTGAIVTVEEHSVTGGLGSAVADVIATRRLDCAFVKFGLPDELTREVGSQAYLRRRAGDLEAVVRETVRPARRHVA